jgi:hypothetical protein
VLERIADPDDEPVVLSELKQQLRTYSSNTDEDGYITNLGIAAREWAESYTGRALMTQTWRLTIDNCRLGGAWPLVLDSVRGPYWGPFWGDFLFPRTGEIRLRRAPVASVETFVSVDPATGAETAVDPSLFALRESNSKFPRLVPQNGANWSQGIFKIEFTAGWDDVDLVPRKFKQAILLHAEAHYDRDPTMMDKLVAAAENLLELECADSGTA